MKKTLINFAITIVKVVIWLLNKRWFNHKLYQQGTVNLDKGWFKILLDWRTSERRKFIIKNHINITNFMHVITACEEDYDDERKFIIIFDTKILIEII